MQIHHDNSIDQSLKCVLEGLKDENENLLDNVDFCDIEKVPGHQNSQFNYTKRADILQGNDPEGGSWSVAFMNSMKWLWLPINDPFVDAFMSSGPDSLIILCEGLVGV